MRERCFSLNPCKCFLNIPKAFFSHYGIQTHFDKELILKIADVSLVSEKVC